MLLHIKYYFRAEKIKMQNSILSGAADKKNAPRL